MFHRIQIFIFAISLCVPLGVSSQEVITVAGIPEFSGYLDGPALEAAFHNPHGIAVDQAGNVFISDRYNHVIRKLSSDGMVSTLAGQSGIQGDIDGPAFLATFNEPWGICVDEQGFVYVADTRNNKIKKISPEGQVSTFAGTGGFGVSDGPALSASFGNPTGLEFDSHGNLFVADHLTHIIRRISPEGQVETIAGTPYVPGYNDGQGINARFNRPYGLTIDQNDEIIVADEWNHRIRKVTPTGSVTTIAGNGEIGYANGNPQSSVFNYPWDVAVSGNGAIYIADGYNHVIRKITDGGNVSWFAGQPGNQGAQDGNLNSARFNGATSLAISGGNDFLFIGDAYNNLIRKISIEEPGIVLDVSSSQLSFCSGSVAEFSVTPLGFDNYNFYLNGNLVQSGTSSQLSWETVMEGNFDLFVSANAQGNTVYSENYSIEVFPVPEVQIFSSGPTVFHDGDSVILYTVEGYSCLWSNGATTSSITIFESGQFNVTAIDINGCSSSSEFVNVDVFPQVLPPAILIEGDSALCPGSTVLLSSSNPSGNSWYWNSIPIANGDTNSIQVDQPGSYQVSYTSPSGQIMFSDPVIIFEVEFPAIDFQVSETIIYEEETIRVEAIGPEWILYEWNFGNSHSSNTTDANGYSAEYTYNAPGEYTITLSGITSEGCFQEVVKENLVSVLPKPESVTGGIFLPNAFTPNGDGVNDIWYIRGNDVVAARFSIFNQWGQMVFQSLSKDQGWDGTYNGQKAIVGNYAYCLEWTDLNGKIHVVSGIITLLN